MKNKIILAALTTFFTASVFAQQSNLKVAVAIAKVYQNWAYCAEYTDIDFYIKTDTGVSGTQVKREVIAELQDKYQSKYKDALRVEGYSNDDDFGNYLTIVLGNANKKNCKEETYGVAFGTSKEQSLKNAVSRLKNNNSHWKEKSGYKIVKQEYFEDVEGDDIGSNSGNNNEGTGSENNTKPQKLEKLKHKN
jgi:hypothetical protein